MNYSEKRRLNLVPHTYATLRGIPHKEAARIAEAHRRNPPAPTTRHGFVFNPLPSEVVRTERDGCVHYRLKGM